MLATNKTLQPASLCWNSLECVCVYIVTEYAKTKISAAPCGFARLGLTVLALPDAWWNFRKLILGVLAVPDASVVSWTSDRPELATCNPQQLLEDMRKFLEARRGKQLQASTFPEAILNGAQLDLNALYRTVCSRGGFAMGTGVNWAGQVKFLTTVVSSHEIDVGCMFLPKHACGMRH